MSPAFFLELRTLTCGGSQRHPWPPRRFCATCMVHRFMVSEWCWRKWRRLWNGLSLDLTSHSYTSFTCTQRLLHRLALTPQHPQNFNHSAWTSMMTTATRNPNSSSAIGGCTYIFLCFGTAHHNSVDIRFAGRYKKHEVLPLPQGQMPWSSLSKCFQLERLWKTLQHRFPSFTKWRFL